MKENQSPLCIVMRIFLHSMNFKSLYMLWGKIRNAAFSYSYREKDRIKSIAVLYEPVM